MSKGEITFGGKPIGETKSITVNRDIDLVDAGDSECITIKGERKLSLAIEVQGDVTEIVCNGKKFVEMKE